jgi:hypothetical protein
MRAHSYTCTGLVTDPYPTLDERLERQRRKKRRKDLLTKEKFDVNEFLKAVPDPAAAYTGGRPAAPVSELYKQHLNAYVKNRFSQFQPHYLDMLIQKNDYHLFPVYTLLTGVLAKTKQAPPPVNAPNPTVTMERVLVNNFGTDQHMFMQLDPHGGNDQIFVNRMLLGAVPQPFATTPAAPAKLKKDEFGITVGRAQTYSGLSAAGRKLLKSAVPDYKGAMWCSRPRISRFEWPSELDINFIHELQYCEMRETIDGL